MNMFGIHNTISMDQIIIIMKFKIQIQNDQCKADDDDDDDAISRLFDGPFLHEV